LKEGLNKVIAFGGIYNSWKVDSSASWYKPISDEYSSSINTCAIITTPNNENTALVDHDRHPLIIDSNNIKTWLDLFTPREIIENIIKPYHSSNATSPSKNCLEDA